MNTPKIMPHIVLMYDYTTHEYVARIDQKEFDLSGLTPSELVQRIINENQVPTTIRQWARNQVARNNRRRFGP